MYLNFCAHACLMTKYIYKDTNKTLHTKTPSLKSYFPLHMEESYEQSLVFVTMLLELFRMEKDPHASLQISYAHQVGLQHEV